MSEKKDSGAEDRIFLAVGVTAVFALVAIPLVAAAAVWLLAGRFLGKRESWMLVAVGVLGWALNVDTFAVGYFTWLGHLVSGKSTLAEIPWLMLVATACLLTGTVGLLASTAIAQKRLPKRLYENINKARTAVPTGSIVPTAEVVAKLKPASPSSGSLTVSASQHSIVNSAPVGERSFPLGIGATGQTVMLSEKEVRTHGVILGATGSGKSKTIEALAGALLDLGWSGMILDLKEDTAPGGMRDWCQTYATAHSVPYQELRLSDPSSPFWFNALSGMGPDEIRDTILTLNEFDDQYWQAINKELLGQMVNLCVWAHQVDPVNFPEPTMYEIGKMLSTGSIPRATKKARAVVLSAMPQLSSEDFRVLENPSPDHAKSAFGFGSKLTLIYDTQAGRTVLRQDAEKSKRMVDVTNRGLTYIGLDSQGKADLTRVISSSVLQRMSVYAAARTTGLITDPDGRAQRFLIVDEANWVNRTITQNLLSRARSAGIAMFLCTQGPKDWIDENGDDWGRLTQNTNVAIVMRQGEPASAELCADYIGTHKQVQTTRSKRVADSVFGDTRVRDADGRLIESESERETDAYLVEPETLRQMGVGEAVLKTGVPHRVEWLRVQMRDPRATPTRR